MSNHSKNPLHVNINLNVRGMMPSADFVETYCPRLVMAMDRLEEWLGKA
jgi:hypothetical protein